MRLIDRDEILNRIGAIVSKFPEEYDEKTYKMIRCEIRNKNREVKAIPIEWLINYEIKNGQEVRLQEAIAQWEKENESRDTESTK